MISFILNILFADFRKKYQNSANFEVSIIWLIRMFTNSIICTDWRKWQENDQTGHLVFYCSNNYNTFRGFAQENREKTLFLCKILVSTIFISNTNTMKWLENGRNCQYIFFYCLNISAYTWILRIKYINTLNEIIFTWKIKIFANFTLLTDSIKWNVKYHVFLNS